jgi:hypothetical protein
VLSSATACAPITSHTTTLGSVPNIATCVIDQTTVMTGQQTPAHDRPANKLAEKLHGLTEKLHSLGHHRTDSDTSGRTRTGRARPRPRPHAVPLSGFPFPVAPLHIADSRSVATEMPSYVHSGTQMLITVLGQLNLIHIDPSSLLTLSSPLCLGLPRCSLLFRFIAKFCNF